MGRGIPLGKVRGVAITADWSVLVIVGILALGLGQGVIPDLVPTTPVALAILGGLVGAIMLMASLTAHELGHALMAKRRGLPVQGIRLWIMGGVAQMDGEGISAKTEMIVAAMGPLVTGLVVLLFGGAALLMSALGVAVVVVVVAAWLAVLNLGLLIFNLIPAFPLDGGRIFRSLIWYKTGKHWEATRIAARVGRGFGWALMGLGAIELFYLSSYYGIWLLLIGWYLDTSAKYEAKREEIQLTMAGVKVSEVMTKEVVVVPSWITVGLLIDQYMRGKPVEAFPTHGLDGTIDGVVLVDDIRRVPANKRSEQRVATIMVPVTSVPRGRPEEMLVDLLRRIGRGAGRLALVFDGEKLVGSVSPNEVALKLHQMQAALPPQV